MKKILLALALASATIGTAAAQGFSYGLKAGANYANVWGKDAPGGNGYKFGFVGGLAANYAINDLASIQIEALYSQKGFKTTDTNFEDAAGNKYKAEGSQNLDYLDIPLLVKIDAGPIFFELGPQAGILLTSKLSSDYKVKNAAGEDIIERSSSSDKDAIIGYNKMSKKEGAIPSFDIGGIVGVGFNPTDALSIGVRYNAGFKTLVDTKNTDAGAEPHIFNNAFQAQIGWMFGAKAGM